MTWSGLQSDLAGGLFMHAEQTGVQYFISLPDLEEGEKILYLQDETGDECLGVFDTIGEAQQAAEEDYKSNY